MITYVKGDIFSSPAQILVNTVNTEGVIGKGVALEFKKRYPEMFTEYKNICQKGQFNIGSLMLWKKSKKWVLLFPTKTTWRKPSQLDYIEKGLQKFADNWDKLQANSIAFPRLGCGNGDLKWNDVKPLMEKYLKKIPMQVYIYVDMYQDPVPEYKNITEIEKWISGENTCDGFEKFVHQLKYLLQRKSISVLGEKVIWIDDETSFIQIGETKVNRTDTCRLWSFVQDVGVFALNEIPEYYHKFAAEFMELLHYLGYVSNIYVSENGDGDNTFVNGYQFIYE